MFRHSNTRAGPGESCGRVLKRLLCTKHTTEPWEQCGGQLGTAGLTPKGPRRDANVIVDDAAAGPCGRRQYSTTLGSRTQIPHLDSPHTQNTFKVSARSCREPGEVDQRIRAEERAPLTEHSGGDRSRHREQGTKGVVTIPALNLNISKNKRWSLIGL